MYVKKDFFDFPLGPLICLIGFPYLLWLYYLRRALLHKFIGERLKYRESLTPFNKCVGPVGGSIFCTRTVSNVVKGSACDAKNTEQPKPQKKNARPKEQAAHQAEEWPLTSLTNEWRNEWMEMVP